MKDKTKTLITDFVLGVVIAGVVIFINRGMDYSFSQRLCDACFVAGVLLLGAGGLRFCKNQGAFDMITYGASMAFYTAFPAAQSPERRGEDFIAYRERKHLKAKPCADLVISGCVYLVLALICLLIYYMV